MKLTFNISCESTTYSDGQIKTAIATFKESPRYDFVNILNDNALIEESQNAYEKFKHKTQFVQVGIGGSSLGPEMLISAINRSDREFFFLNNIDADHTHETLRRVNFDKAVFYVVSKSGGTAETMAQMAIVVNELYARGVKEEDLKDYFIFATDPVKSELKDLGESLGVRTLTIPSNVGGRFSVLTAVGTLPALFAGYDINKLVSETHNFAKYYIDSDEFLKLTSTVLNLYDQGFDQTVLMPYSSKLRDLSFWFVQLWAESLGKKRGDERIGLTPIPSYGATDQHSQMQLFMEGPLNKLMFMVNVANTEGDFPLENNFDNSKLQKLKDFSLKNLMDAEFFGTLKALCEQGVPYVQFQIDRIDELSIGKLILAFELLTAITGITLNIDPFDQPGVEAGKVYSFEWLSASNQG
jgi:glucose-6-phosphate isomerase